MSKYRWILYLSQNIPGHQSFDLERVRSIDEARGMFEEFCRAVYSDDCHVFAYHYSDDNWIEAERFRNIGCPFDYPDYVVERGLRGGIQVTRG